MTEWLGLVLDLILIVLVGTGIVQAMRLMKQLKDLRSSRADMERFVREFNNAVMRADAGIKGLRAAARESGDDLEKLVEKGVAVRDELTYIVESADSVAERLSVAASQALHGVAKPDDARKPAPAAKPPAASSPIVPAAAPKSDGPPASRAEKELLQALQKLK